MAVKIEIKGNRDTSEYAAAKRLKKIFQQGFSQAVEGNIVILCNATLFGQATKDLDIIVYGNLNGYKRKMNFTKENGIINGEVFINNFCFCIETKRHAARDVVLDGLVLKVRYNGKLHDVTHQSEKQKYALKQFIEDRTNGKPPYICNFIWLEGVSTQALRNLLGTNNNARTKHNYLPSDFTLAWLFQLACVQRHPFQPQGKNYYICNAVSKSNDIHNYNIYDSLSLLTDMRNTLGDLTRKKIERITKRLIKEQNYADAIGKKLLVIAGRAGTGKTIKLLRLAYDLARNQGKRCLILTYNLALVSDIKRLLALARMPDDIDSHSVNIETLHKFFYELAIGFGFGKESNNGVKYIDDFIPKYQKYLADLNDYIQQGAIGQKDIQNLMRSRHDEIAWDFILVDEAQDWDSSERDLIYKLFTPSKVIIADGIDQMVRSQQHCNWARNIEQHRIHERKCLRQKPNLVEFVNKYSEEFDLGWELEPVEEYEGGKVIISASPMPYELLRREFKICEDLGNRAYEMMFLAPPSLVQRQNGGSDGQKASRCFAMTEEFAKQGFRLWDGTQKDLRSNYPTDVNEHRLLQYDSCRGLECWTVVCLQLDEFARYKRETYKQESGQVGLFQEDESDKKERFVHLWGLMPLTRAIDTVVITLRDKNSEFAQRLRSLADRMQDFVEWVD